VPLLSLTPELLLLIADELGSQKDMSALARTCSHFHHFTNPHLYKHNAKHDDCSALVWAATHKSLSDEGTTTAQLSIEAGANLETLYEGRTVLYLATSHGHTETVALLLEKGAHPDSFEICNQFTPLSWATGKGYRSIARLLIEHGAIVNMMNNGQDLEPYLHKASGAGYHLIIELLLGHGANNKARARRNFPPLHRATHYPDPVSYFEDAGGGLM
jgi:ankyrin repeat protein